MNELLKNLYLFRGLAPEHLQMLDEIATLGRYRPGEQVFRQGSKADGFYVIQHGTVSIEQEMADSTSVEVSTLGTGSHFGEMPFLDEHPRSATATAKSHASIVRIEYADFGALLVREQALAVHVYREFSRFLCSRLRSTTLDLSYSKRQDLGLF